MSYSNKCIKIGILAMVFISTAAFSIEIKDNPQAVNVAGKQRMFTQKLLKNYVMIGMNNTFGNPQKSLTKTVNQFEESMQALYDFTKDETIKKSIDKSKKMWVGVKENLEKEPVKLNVEKLQLDLEALLKAADDTTKLFAATSGKTSDEIINISGRQRMLSQRMAGLYMLKVWGIEDSQFQKKLFDSMALFETSGDKLMKYEGNTQEIVTLLKKAKRSYMFFEFMSKSKNKFIPSLIYKKSNQMLKDMNTVTGLYTKIKTQ
jgi:hypothetical protein